MDRSPGVDEYLAGVSGARASVVEAIREACLQELDGFEEGIAHGMPTYSRGVDNVAFANQKQYVSLYVDPAAVDAHRNQLGGLACGKSCIRYRHPDQLDL